MDANTDAVDNHTLAELFEFTRLCPVLALFGST